MHVDTPVDEGIGLRKKDVIHKKIHIRLGKRGCGKLARTC
jgi:hypothetical protein